MKHKDIQIGHWYLTKKGTGIVLQTTGYHPPAIQINIKYPFPRGTIFLTARDFINEVDNPTKEN